LLAHSLSLYLTDGAKFRLLVRAVLLKCLTLLTDGIDELVLALLAD